MNFLKEKLKSVNQTLIEVATSTGNFLESAGKSIKETTEKTIDGAKNGIFKGTEAISKTIKDQKHSFNLSHPSDCSDFLTEIYQKLYWMPFPEDDLLEKYSKLLNKEYGTRFRIWNISEYSYNPEPFNDQVYEYVYVGYPNPPLIEIYMVCKEIISWIDVSEDNIAIVHCQKSLIRSYLIFGCFSYMIGECSNPSESLEMISRVV